MKILIIRFSSIGDIVLTSPVARCLKKQLGAEVHFLTKKNFEKILFPNPYIDRVFSIEKHIKEVINNLKSMDYDCVIDLHNNLRTRQIKWALGIKSYSFNKLNIEKWLMVNLKINSLPSVHIVDRYLKTIEKLGVINDNLGLDYFIPNTDEIDFITWENPFQLRGGDFIAFVIGAAHPTKRLPADKIIEICNGIEKPILLLGGKEDSKIGQLVENQSIAKVLNLCGKLNLNQSASIVRQAYKVITHDTGLMHIAAAFKKDIISVWGNTIPEFGMTPYLPSEKSRIFEVKNLKCRPCSKIGFQECPKGHFKCMRLQKIPEIIRMIA
jgi:ADP-heptose:LPS heptosyltransferase